MARIYSSVISFHKFIQIETQNLKSYEDPQEEVCQTVWVYTFLFVNDAESLITYAISKNDQ